MNVLVFGASGGTGRECVKQALAQGHSVTAFVRDPTTFDSKHPNLQVVQGDVVDYASVERAVHNQDAALCALGSSSPLKRDPTLRGEWEDRILVETVLSMLTLVCHCKKVMHRVWEYCHARLACTMAAFHLLVQWHSFQPTASGFVPLSMAEFRL
jgi:NAD(P)H-binding